MARLPTIESTAGRRLLPSANLQIGGGTPEAFGAAAGRGVQALGGAGQEVAQAVQTFELAKAREAEQAAEFDRQAQFVKFGSEESERLTQVSRDLDGPATDFTKSFMTSFDQRRDEFLAKVPERNRAQWQSKFEALRGQVSGAALKTEFGQRDAWSRDGLKTSLNSLQNGVAQAPGRVDDYRRQGEELINSSLLGRQDKAEAVSAWRSQVAIAAAMGDVELDPNGALARLGGVDPVTIYDYETGKPRQGAAAAAEGGKIVVQNRRHLLNAIEQVESSGRPGVPGPQTRYGQAHGAMQVLDSTGKEVAAKLNIAWRPDLMRGTTVEAHEYQRWIGQAYFEEGLERYGGDVRKALMFYHGGPDEKKWGPNTHAYVGKVLAKLPAGAATIIPAMAQRDPDPAKLKPIPAGWKGNQEDAIQELGMNADQAAEFVKTGVDPRTVEQATALADPAEPPPIAPRYADLPFSARMQLIGGAQREIERRENVQHAAEQKAHEERINQLLVDLNDGKAGTADITAARKAGWLTDYDEINRAEGILEEKHRKGADLALFNTMTSTPGFAFNQFDSDQKRAVEAGVEALGNTPMAAFQVWQKTGILATKGAQALRGSILSTDPAHVAQAASIASNMIEHNPNAFTGIDGGEEIERNAMLYRHYVSDLGRTSEEAVRAVAASNSPEAKRSIAANAEAEREFRKTVQKTDAANVLSNAFGGWFTRDPDFTSPEQKAVVQQDFADLAWDHYKQHRDAGAANAYATQQIKKLYGVVDGRLMKYPPTRAYPPRNGSWDYLFEQAANDVKSVTGKKVDPDDVYLMPLPTATAEAFRAGRPVPYEVHYVEKVDGQEIYQVLHGKAFVGDVGAQPQAGPTAEQRFRQGQKDRAALSRALQAGGDQWKRNPMKRGRDY